MLIPCTRYAKTSCNFKQRIQQTIILIPPAKAEIGTERWKMSGVE